MISIHHSKVALFTALLGSTLPTCSHAFQFGISPHAGIDYKYWNVEPKEIYDDTFPRLDNGYSIYAGLRFGDFRGFDWGFDVGFEESESEERSYQFTVSEQFFDYDTAAGDVTNVAVRLRAWHMNLNLYYALRPCLDLFGYVGLAFHRPHTDANYTHNGLTTDLQFDLETKINGRFGFGADWMFFQWAGIRALVMFDNLQRLSFKGESPNFPFFNTFEGKPYKNTTSFYLGFVVQTGMICVNL